MILRSRAISGLWHRRKAALIALVLTSCLFLLFLHTDFPRETLRSYPIPPADPLSTLAPGATSIEKQRPPDAFLEKQASFWRNLYQIILNNDPNCNHVSDPVVPQKLDIQYDPSHDHPRPDLLFVETSDVNHLREAHSNFVRDLARDAPEMVHNPGTRGIVMTGGIKQLPVLVISIRMIRKAKSDLPIEVFVADPSEWDERVCGVVLPSLNAKCLMFYDIFHTANTGVEIDRFQFKIMAILFSSFEEVLLLDSDAFPIRDPLPLFEEEPFKSTGMILWPDFWYASESPYYFNIAKIEAPALTVRASVESGEVMYSKTKHNMSLMLAAYYNYYGPHYYYPLLSQGAPGEGDKETFGWAATAMGEPFYAVHQKVRALGRLDSSGDFLGSAMAQHDPLADYADTLAHGPPHERDNYTDSDNDIKPFFIHANFPKFDPSTVFEKEAQGGPTRDSNGTDVRCWMDLPSAVEIFGFDVERGFWEEIKGVACDLERQLDSWKDKDGICAHAQKYWNNVFA